MADVRLRTCLGTLSVLILGVGCGTDSMDDGGKKSSRPTEAPMVSNPSTMSPSAAGSGATPMQPVAAPNTPSQGTPPAMNPNVTPPAGGNNPPAMTPTTPVDPTTPDPSGAPKPLAMDECGLNTKFPGDEYCLLPPPPDKGFQIHVGPTNYDNPEPQYILAAGDEATNDFKVTSGNTSKKFFYYRQFRMRPSAHHNIVTSSAGGGFGMGRRIGTSNHLAEDSPSGGVIAPENEGVGIEIAPNQTINVNLHSINISDKPMLREVWINFWYRDESEVTESVEEMFQTGDVTFAVQPREDKVLGPYKCTIQGNGRMLWFYGHRHANNVRFSVWRNRGSQRDLFYEGLNWEEPLVLEFSSTVKNPVPDRAKNIEGGWSGILDMKAGDVIEWECHVINKTDGVLRFANETYTAEMCIMDAELVGANCASAFGAAAGAGAGFTPER